MKNHKGITLIALVITIIVMLILVGVTINIAVNGGLFTYAEKASKEIKFQSDDEQIQAIYATTQMAKYLNKDNSFSDEIKKEFGQDTVVKNENGAYTVILTNGDKHTVGHIIKNNIITPEDIQNEGLTDNYKIKVAGYDFCLDGDVSLYIYFQIPEEEFINGEVIKLTNPRRTDDTNIIEIDVKKENFKTKQIDNNVYYSIRYDLISCEMADEIKICAYNGETKASDEYKTSMKSVGEKIIRNTSNSQELRNYVKALLNYGGYSQEWFDYYTENLANSGNGIKVEIDVDKIGEQLANYESNINYITEDFDSIFTSISYANYAGLGITGITPNINENFRFLFNGEEIETDLMIANNKKIISFINQVKIPYEDLYKKFDFKVLNSNNQEVLTGKISVVECHKKIINGDYPAKRKLAAASQILLQKAYMEMAY